MKNKKTIALLLCIGMFVSTYVCAQEIDISEGSRTVTLTEQAAPDAGVMLVVVKGGSPVEDNSQIYAVKHSKTDNNGNVVFGFDMPEYKNGNLSDGSYDLWFKEEGKPAVKKNMIYATKSSRDVFLATIQAIATKQDVAAVIENVDYDVDETDKDNDIVLNAIGCDMQGYKDINDKDLVQNIIFEYIEDFSMVKNTEFARVFNMALNVAEINSSGTVGDITSAIGVINPIFEGAEYNDITDLALVEWIGKRVYENKPYISLDALQDTYNKANILWKIKNSRVDDITDVLTEYAAGLGIDTSSEYIAYTRLVDHVTADTVIVTALKQSPAKDTDSLKLIIASGVKEQNRSSNNGGGSGSGGSSGGLSTGSSSSGINLGNVGIITPIGKKAWFKDLDEALWAEDAIEALAINGIVSGDENGNFNPNNTLKREEVVKMLVDALKIYDENAECDFVDTDKSKWHYRYIASAYNKGLVSGISDTDFGIGVALTRQDMVVLVARAAEMAGRDSAVREMCEFNDFDSISEYARSAVEKMYMAGVVNGMNADSFVPFGTATRAQGALVIYNVFLK